MSRTRTHPNHNTPIYRSRKKTAKNPLIPTSLKTCGLKGLDKQSKTVTLWYMALIKTGQGITDIRGGLGGSTFTRDKSGLHCIPKRRNIRSPSPAQITQRKAFIAARVYSTDNRTVSYNIYRILNGLEPGDPPLDYQIPTL